MSSKIGLKLRRKRTVCICIIVYAALCVLAFHSFTSIAIGLIVIAVAAVKLKKYNDEIKMDEKTESIMEWIGSMSDEESEKFFEESRQRMLDEIEEEYDDPNATYSAADLLGISSDDEDSTGEEEEEYDDPNATYSAADLLGTSSSKATKSKKTLKRQKLQKQENLASNFEFYRNFLIFTSQTNYL